MRSLYGIPNCDTVKKARKKLDELGLEYQFIDFKKSPPTATILNKAKKFLGDWPVNKKGRTFRTIKENYEAAKENTKRELLIENSSAIKRPILEQDGEVIAVGFDPEVYLTL
jgi:arsenate reductase (glutaredoxin)